MIAIQTKFMPESVRKSYRIKAWTAKESIFIPYDETFDFKTNHLIAAERLARSHGFVGEWNGAMLPNGDMCFVANNEINFTVTQKA